MNVKNTKYSFLWLIVPVLMLFEFGLHLRQKYRTHHRASDLDWAEVHKRLSASLDFMGPEASAQTLILFAPSWLSPIGRMHLSSLMTLERAAYSDLSRFSEVWVVSQDNEELPEFSSWHRWYRENVKKVGPLEIHSYINLEHETVRDDLLSHVNQSDLIVSTLGVGGDEKACSYVSSSAKMRAPYEAWGVALAPIRFECPVSSVGVSVFPDLEYRPRLCIYVPTQGPGKIARLTFSNVQFKEKIVGHHAIHAQSEHEDKHGAPVELSFFVKAEDPGRPGEATRVLLSHHIHVDGQGWAEYRFDTKALDGQRGDLIVEVTSKERDRPYCFEATSRYIDPGIRYDSTLNTSSEHAKK